MTQHLHMSLGPVQGFVAQARRTRDLWGGSYLLSFLAAHAMRAVRQAGATIVRPRVDDDPLLRWVERGAGHGGAPPRLGSLPNQFTVELAAAADPHTVAEVARHAFEAAWDLVCDAVWRTFLAAIAARGRDTEAIWRRQTRGFWELVWVAGAPDDHGLLDRRKQWRTHHLPEEAGDKCTVMPELQELSGYVRATARDARERQDAFWAALRQQLGQLELRNKERLCAIALVKRLYARTSDAVGGELDVTRWPSTIDVAAVLWAREAVAVAPRQAETFADAVVAHTAPGALTGGVSSLLPDARCGHFLRLGASWFHRAFVANPALAPLRDERGRAELLDRLRALTKTPTAPRGTLGSPPIYYALLLADGDRLGELVRTYGGSDGVARSLARFTGEAPDIVSSHLGVTIYAGGDDVLAILPIQRALACAQEVEAAYRRAFGLVPATLSAAVVFAHARSPLNRVLAEAHRLLADVAKEQNGRSSLAAAVHRGQAPAVQWVTTWDRASAGGTRKPAATCVREVADEMARDRAPLSSSLLHDLRRTLGLLCGDASTEPGSFAALPEGIEIVPLVKAEIGHRLSHNTDHGGVSDPEELERLTSLVSHLLARSRSNEDGAPEPDDDRPTYLGIDGLVLASFLANDGREDEHRP